MKSICVFCGSNPGVNPVYAEAARELAATLLARGLRLVYGGGSVGLMGIIADAMLTGGGEVVGVLPHSLWKREVGHGGLTKLHLVETMHERKTLMADLSDGFVALPGGAGTLDEAFEIWTWAQLGIHNKPCGLLNIQGFFDALLVYLKHAVGEGFLKSHHLNMLMVDANSTTLLDRFAAYRTPNVPSWSSAGGGGSNGMQDACQRIGLGG
ncbi:MAG: TIGR00730 family Rossman fold protein [Planctomycetes bacterium]|nr:TIGR00730 family Rossman fold protein [Planctomycetota bacterium]